MKMRSDFKLGNIQVRMIGFDEQTSNMIREACASYLDWVMRHLDETGYGYFFNAEQIGVEE